MYHIGVSFNVVRFDKMGLPGPLFMKRATGKFTLTFCCVVNRLFHIKKLEVWYSKLSFYDDVVEVISEYYISPRVIS